MTFAKIELLFYSSMFGLLCAACGWLANHRLATNRAKRDRRGAFVGYLLQWRSTIARKSHSYDVFAVFREGVHAFHLEFGKIREDYLEQKAFIETAEALGSLTETEIIRDGLDGRVPIFALLDKLVALTK